MSKKQKGEVRGFGLMVPKDLAWAKGGYGIFYRLGPSLLCLLLCL